MSHTNGNPLSICLRPTTCTIARCIVMTICGAVFILCYSAVEFVCSEILLQSSTNSAKNYAKEACERRTVVSESSGESCQWVAPTINNLKSNDCETSIIARHFQPAGLGYLAIDRAIWPTGYLAVVGLSRYLDIWMSGYQHVWIRQTKERKRLAHSGNGRFIRHRLLLWRVYVHRVMNVVGCFWLARR